MGNVISGLAFVVFAGVFWVQRNYTSKFGGLFADPVIIAMAVLGLVLALLGLVQRRPSEHKSEVPLARLIRAVLLLVAWVALLPTLGYVVGSLVFFVLTALLMAITAQVSRGSRLTSASPWGSSPCSTWSSHGCWSSSCPSSRSNQPEYRPVRRTRREASPCHRQPIASP